MRIISKNSLGLDYRIIYKSLALLVVFFLPVGYVHEAGHALGCLYGGGKYMINFSVTGEQSTICSGNITDDFAYHASGGSLAAAASSTPLIFWKRLPPYAKIISLAFATGQALNGLVESLLYQSYMTQTGTWSILFAEAGLGIFLGLVIKYARSSK